MEPIFVNGSRILGPFEYDTYVSEIKNLISKQYLNFVFGQE